MLDAMAALLTYQAGIYFGTGQRPSRRGNKHPSIVPYEVFKASDAYLHASASPTTRCGSGAARRWRARISIKDPRFVTGSRPRAEPRRAGAAAQRGAGERGRRKSG